MRLDERFDLLLTSEEFLREAKGRVKIELTGLEVGEGDGGR